MRTYEEDARIWLRLGNNIIGAYAEEGLSESVSMPAYRTRSVAGAPAFCRRIHFDSVYVGVYDLNSTYSTAVGGLAQTYSVGIVDDWTVCPTGYVPLKTIDLTIKRNAGCHPSEWRPAKW